jgi:hypothetical protein
MKFYEETLDSYQLQLLIQCTSEFGYGNWDAISKLYNSIIHEEYHKEKWNYLSEQSDLHFYLNFLHIIFL